MALGSVEMFKPVVRRRVVESRFFATCSFQKTGNLCFNFKTFLNYIKVKSVMQK